MRKIVFPMLGLALAFSSCKNNDEDINISNTSEEKAKLVIQLDHEFNGIPLNFNSKYFNENGDSIKISELKYFISHLTLKSNESELILGDLYKLIQPTSESNKVEIAIENLDEANYKFFSLAVGVDSARNHSIENAVDDLDPAGADQMIWSWATGYKFVKFEGSYTMPDSSGNFIYHVGGDANYKVFEFGSTTVSTEELNISLQCGKTTEIHLVVDLAEVFKSPNLLDVRKPLGHAGGATIMNNIYTSDNSEMNGWFQLHHIMTVD